MIQDAKQQYLQARQLWKDGNIKEAEALYRQLISAKPAFPHPYYDLGVLREAADKEEAANLYERFILLASSNAALFSLIMQAQERLKALKSSVQGEKKEIPTDRVGSAGTATLKKVFRNSSYVFDNKYPDAFIRQRWASGERISELLCTNTPTPSWFCVASLVDKKVEQSMQTCDALSPDLFNKWQDQGWAIEDLVYAQSQCTVLLEKKSQGIEYGISHSSEFPASNIKEGWEHGFDIHRIIHGNGKWIILWKKGLNYRPQKYLTFTDNPTFSLDKLKTHQEDGFITDVSFGGGLWTVVFSKGTSIQSQVCFQQAMNVPMDNVVKKNWEEGYAITSVANGNFIYLVVMSK